MKIDLNQFRKTFLQESAENASLMESGLLELQSASSDADLLNSIFRAAHSIKGGAGSFGYTNLVRFTHTLETLLDRMRSLEMPVTEEVIAVLLRSVDTVRVMLDAEPSASMSPEAEDLEKQIAALCAVGANAAGLETMPQATTETESHPLGMYRVEFRPHPDLFSSGSNPILLLRNLAELGSVSCCHLHDSKLPSLSDLDPSRCYLSWTIEMASAKSEQELKEVFEFVEHLAEITVQNLDAADPAPASASETKPETTRNEDAAQSPRDRRRDTAVARDASSIRVPTDKIDKIIDLVGELVIAHVMAKQMVEDFEPSCLPKLHEAIVAMDRNTRELHERVMAVRMLPVGTLFQRFPRIVHDISETTGKPLKLVVQGEESEIDKSMLELLVDPLTHLVRNACDHGIETAEDRRSAGKPSEGSIGLKAYHRAGRVVIEVSDDGAGIDTDRVRTKAVERGIIAADSVLSEEQLRLLIFEPGFSTRETISDLSGRGVGMDVVQQNVRQMNGTISLSSEKGRGVTVSIELPLTLAILDGLLVRVADRTLVVPLLAVIETVPLGDGQIVRVANHGEVVVIRGESIPLLRLSRFLGLSTQLSTGTTAHHRLAVIVEAGQKKIGLVVDELLGLQQVVVKSLERNLHRVDGLMGATILGDGCVAPIVDVTNIVGLNLFSLQLGELAQRGPLSASFNEVNV